MYSLSFFATIERLSLWAIDTAPRRLERIKRAHQKSSQISNTLQYFRMIYSCINSEVLFYCSFLLSTIFSFCFSSVFVFHISNKQRQLIRHHLQAINLLPYSYIHVYLPYICVYAYVGHRRRRRNEFATLQIQSTLTVELGLTRG